MTITTAAGLVAAVLLVVTAVNDGRPPWVPAVATPDVAPASIAGAVARLEAAGLKPRFVGVPALVGGSTGRTGWSVAGQYPAAGRPVAVGGTVRLRLMLGANGGGILPAKRDSVTVPDVRGVDITPAIDAIVGLGLLVDVPATGERDELVVRSQSPAPGTVTTQGTHVTLRL